MTSARKARIPSPRAVSSPRAGAPVPPPIGTDARRRRDQAALADIRDALERDDPAFTRSFGVLTGHRPGRWLAGLAGCAVLAGVAFAVLGVRAVGVLALLLVLGSPVVVCLGVGAGRAPPAGRPADGPPPR